MPKSWFHRLHSTLKPAKPTTSRRGRLRRRFLVEPLEGRQMLSTLYVTTAGDNGSNTNPLAGSLRAEILAADSAAAYTTIDFQISGSGLHEIELQTPLPAITKPVNLNGLSQSGSTATSPLIQVDGANAGSVSVGLDIQNSASGTATNPSQVSGLEITDFSAGGVNVDDASYVNLNALFVGITKVGSIILDEGNSHYGVQLYEGSNDTVTGCVVSANQGSGLIASDVSHAALTGDFIGTDATGELSVDQNGNSLGNNGTGVVIVSGAAYTMVTHTVVANNNGQGVELSDTHTDYNTLAGDFIGTDLLGTHALPNQQDGVLITNAAIDNTIGGTGSGSANVLSANTGDGVDITGSRTAGNLVEGDFIGTDVTGSLALGDYDGVVIQNGRDQQHHRRDHRLQPRRDLGQQLGRRPHRRQRDDRQRGFGGLHRCQCRRLGGAGQRAKRRRHLRRRQQQHHRRDRFRFR